MGMADLILAGEGDLYDINEIRLMILAQFWHNLFMRTLYSIYWFCVFHISKLTNTYSYSINAPLSLFCFCHVC